MCNQCLVCCQGFVQVLTTISKTNTIQKKVQNISGINEKIKY
jgi:hypothetical protein